MAVLGNTQGVVNVLRSIECSEGYVCRTAIIENYYGRNFWRYFFSIPLKAKAKLLYRALRNIKHYHRLLRKISKVYFNVPDRKAQLLELIPNTALKDVDMFLIACDDEFSSREEHKTSDYVSFLMRHGVSKDKIYVVPHNMAKAELPVFLDGRLSPLCKNIAYVKPVLRYMEYHVTDFCNLKCKGCTHMAEYVRTLDFHKPEDFKLSLEKLREKFENIITIRIMGGEPLLCKSLHEYINVAHEVFPYSNIKIVTNALLYKNITPLTIKAMRDAGAEFNVSQYPPTREIAPEFIAFCQENGLRVAITSPVKKFYRWIVSGRDASLEEIWFCCPNRYCHFLHSTTLYPCPLFWTHSEPKFREILGKNAFSESESREYSYDLSKDIADDGWDILAKIDNPFELCRKCGDKTEFFKWESEAGKN